MLFVRLHWGHRHTMPSLTSLRWPSLMAVLQLAQSWDLANSLLFLSQAMSSFFGPKITGPSCMRDILGSYFAGKARAGGKNRQSRVFRGKNNYEYC